MERIIDFMINYPVTCLMGLLVISFLVGQWLIYRDSKPNPKYRIVLDGNGDYRVQKIRFKNETRYWSDVSTHEKQETARERMKYLIEMDEKEARSKQIIKVIDAK